MEMGKFTNILNLSIGKDRTAALVQWVQNLYRPDDELPVLVGGSAVELFTGGAYVTGDLDFVGSVPSYVRKALTDAGFFHEGRHWIHEEGRVFLKFPSSALGDGEQAENRTFSGHSILIISPEDLIVDRLAAWVHWVSGVDGVNAYLLYQALGNEIDLERLRNRAREADVSKALDSVRILHREFKGERPGNEILEAWATKTP